MTIKLLKLIFNVLFVYFAVSIYRLFRRLHLTCDRKLPAINITTFSLINNKISFSYVPTIMIKGNL